MARPWPLLHKPWGECLSPELALNLTGITPISAAPAP
ncbi:MAG: hypothetical protein JWP92_1126, partial [Caulobacter sp.]|nr:hypothetical protein [Caulobacter sp.]MDB5455541.1 hypothetical protein [Caulobacter sp.]